MTRFIARLIVPFVALSAFAQSAAEAPVEKASGFTVVLFIVLFVGLCGAVLWMSVLSGRKEKRAQEELAQKTNGG